MADPNAPAASFDDLGLDPAVLAGLEAVGYEKPSPIQAETIPHLTRGSDLIGQAQTGTGKTFTMEGVNHNEELKGIIPRAFG